MNSTITLRVDLVHDANLDAQDLAKTVAKALGGVVGTDHRLHVWGRRVVVGDPDATGPAVDVTIVSAVISNRGAA